MPKQYALCWKDSNGLAQHVIFTSRQKKRAIAEKIRLEKHPAFNNVRLVTETIK